MDGDERHKNNFLNVIEKKEWHHSKRRHNSLCAMLGSMGFIFHIRHDIMPHAAHAETIMPFLRSDRRRCWEWKLLMVQHAFAGSEVAKIWAPSVPNPQDLNQQHLLHIWLLGGMLFSLQAICPGEATRNPRKKKKKREKYINNKSCRVGKKKTKTRIPH